MKRNTNSKRNTHALVISAVELSASEKREIQTLLKRKLKRDIHITNKVNEDVIGGLYIRVGDAVINATLQNKIEKLRERLRT